MKPTPIATPVKAFEAIAPATNLKPITNNKNVANEYCKGTIRGISMHYGRLHNDTTVDKSA